jgi:hypothetical protein
MANDRPSVVCGEGIPENPPDRILSHFGDPLVIMGILNDIFNMRTALDGMCENFEFGDRVI